MTTGIHHTTGITGDAQANVDFYADLLGLRLVKRTVSHNDPTDLARVQWRESSVLVFGLEDLKRRAYNALFAQVILSNLGLEARFEQEFPVEKICRTGRSFQDRNREKRGQYSKYHFNRAGDEARSRWQRER